MSVTYYVALPFLEADGALVPGQAQECTSEVAAIRRADAMSRNAPNVGALAFKRSGDPNLGSYADATILRTFGDVPKNIDEL
jgi:hypothetical protein